MPKRTKFRIAYCIPSLYIAGGMERVLTLKANYFAEELGYEIYIILTDGNGKIPFFPLSPKISVIDLGVNFDDAFQKPFFRRSLQFLIKYPKYKKKLEKCLKGLKPDIAISMIRREITFFTSLKDGSIKIGEVHINREIMHDNFGHGFNGLKSFISKYWMKRLIQSLKELDRYVVLTQAERKNWKEIEDIVVINNPVAFFPERSSLCNSKKVIAVGRYLPVKRFDLLIDVWKIVTDRNPEWELHIYGGGDSEKLNNHIMELGLAEKCILDGPVSNIAEKYLDSSIFVMSSQSEGFPMALCEAMACGLPSVTFLNNGTSEIIHNNEDGILIENGNLSQMAEALCYLIGNEDVRKQIGKYARMNIERLKIEKIALQWQQLFESLVNKGRGVNVPHVF